MLRSIALTASLALAACAPAQVSTRGGVAPPTVAYEPVFALAAVEVNVPRTLSVSEADRLYPIADIVWRGEAPGDRHEQVAAIFRDGADAASGSLTSGERVTARIDVARFHSVSEKARALVGGDHDMKFTLTLVDAASGEVVHGPKEMRATLDAHGGAMALAAEQRGEGMRVRIVEHIAGVLRKELSREIAGAPAAPLAPTAQATARF